MGAARPVRPRPVEDRGRGVLRGRVGHAAFACLAHAHARRRALRRAPATRLCAGRALRDRVRFRACAARRRPHRRRAAARIHLVPARHDRARAGGPRAALGARAAFHRLRGTVGSLAPAGAGTRYPRRARACAVRPRARVAASVARGVRGRCRDSPGVPVLRMAGTALDRRDTRDPAATVPAMAHARLWSRAAGGARNGRGRRRGVAAGARVDRAGPSARLVEEPDACHVLRAARPERVRSHQHPWFSSKPCTDKGLVATRARRCAARGVDALDAWTWFQWRHGERRRAGSRGDVSRHRDRGRTLMPEAADRCT